MRRMPDIDPNDRSGRRIDLLPIILLLALGALIVGVWWGFPMFARYMSNQDCIATGHTNC
jgi:hypothetical protein